MYSIVICQGLDSTSNIEPSKALIEVLHHPNKVLFNSRAFELEVFTDFLQKELESVSLFYKTDDKPQFIEIPFDLKSNRYVFTYDPRVNPANEITYFFTVIHNNGSVYATPIDKEGNLKPLTQSFVDPVEYYKQRAAYKN
jgi:hypothetical protein